MTVGAWCWLDGGRRLRISGCLDTAAAAMLVEEVRQRRAPREVLADNLALTPGAAAKISRALPLLAAARHTRRSAHDVRNRLAVLRLRLQLLGSDPGVPGKALARAIASLDEVTGAIGRLAP